MNPDLQRLHPYPFEQLRRLLSGATPPADLPHINMSIGEPRHPTPPFILQAYAEALPGVATYPPTAGTPALREACAAWAQRRYGLKRLDADTEVLPVSGTKEALFALAQVVIDRTRPAQVLAPNPFYQLYEGAAMLAGAMPRYLATTPENGLRMDFGSLTDAQWAGVQLVYVCSPGNPTGRVMTLPEWQQLFDLADRHDFVIASDECYSEVYFDEAQPPLGALTAAQQLGRDRWQRLLVFYSLSKRSSVPGMRSGFVAGDAGIVRDFLLYRTYHGAAMATPVQAASIAAWRDEAHVIENRRLYAQKFTQATPVIARALDCAPPEAAFYLWARTPGSDTDYARRLYAECNITVMPGSFMSRTVDGINPGSGFVRIALVAEPHEVAEAARRIASLAS